MADDPPPTEPSPGWPGLTRALEQERAYLVGLTTRRLGPGLVDRLGAEDIAQDVLVVAWQRRDAFGGASPDALRAWLRQILDYVISARQRYHFADKRSPDRQQSNADVDLIDPITPVSQRAMQSEAVSDIRRRVAALPEHDRLLVYFTGKGLSHKVIALITGLPSDDAVRQKLKRIRDKLR